MTPAVSVFIPVYNDQDRIERAVTSILRQTWQDLELVVLDDGSTDQTPKILARFDDPRLRVIRQENAGVAAAGNSAAAPATAEFIARLDGDDASTPHRIARQLSYMRAHPECVVCGCGWTVHSTDGAEMERTTVPTDPVQLRWRQLWRVPFPNSTLLMRRTAFEAVGGYDENFHRAFPFNCDFDLIERLSRIGELGAVSEPLVEWYYDAESGISPNNVAAQRESSAEICRRQLVELIGGVRREDAAAAWRLMRDPKRLRRGDPARGAVTIAKAADAFLKRWESPETAQHVRASLEQRGKALRGYDGIKGPRHEIAAAGRALEAYARSGKMAISPPPTLRRVKKRLRSIFT